MMGEHCASDPTPQKWYERTAFEIPRDANGVADFDNVGRNTMQEDGIFNWDIRLQKSFYPSFSVPNRNVRSSAGGTIRGTNTTPRQMQFGLRIVF